MNNKLILASAGAGKTTLISKSAIKKSKCKKSILILTYTRSNQKELKQKIVKLNKTLPSNVKIKGWFSFLLEEMIRPYQNCIFENRISGIIFNETDPHKRNGRTIPGRKELINNKYNPIYYLSKDKKRAHTTYLSKLMPS